MSAVLELQKPDHHPFVRKLSLHAALPQQVLLSQLEAGLIANPSEAIPLLNAWGKANSAYRKTGTPSRSFLTGDDLRLLEGASGQDQEEVLDRLRVYSPFDTHGVTLHAARVSKLVTPQLSLNPARAAARASVRPGMTAEDFFRVAFQEGARMEPVNRQVLAVAPNGGSVLFTSYDEDVRPHQPIYQDSRANVKDEKGDLLPSICFPVGRGTGFAHAYRVSIGQGLQRLILVNGIHRVYELARQGVEWLPLAICDVQSMEAPDQLVDFPKQLILDPNFNAPLLVDFLNPEVVLELDYFRVLKSVRLNWSAEQYATVLR